MEIKNDLLTELGLGGQREFARYSEYAQEGGKVVQPESMYSDFAFDPAAAAERKKGMERILHELVEIFSPGDNPHIVQPRFSDNQLMEGLSRRHIKIRAKKDWIWMPGMEPTLRLGPYKSEEERNRVYDEMLANPKVTVKIEKAAYDTIVVQFPSPSYSAGKRAPKYLPTFQTFGSNQGLLKEWYEGLIEGRFGGKKNTELAISLYNQAREIFQTEVVCSGTLDGMLTRFVQMRDAAIRAREARKERPADVERMVELLRRWIPKDPNIVLFNLTGPDLWALMKAKIIINDEDGNEIERKDWHLKLNHSANAGVLWNGVGSEKKATKGQTFLADMQIATNIMIKLGQEYKEEFGTRSQLIAKYGKANEENLVKKRETANGWAYRVKLTQEEIMENFWTEYEYIVAFNMFPKTDPYVIAKLREKTRIISGRGTYETMSSSIVLTPFLDSLQTFVDKGPCYFIPGKGLIGGSMSMLKVSPFNGNFHIMYQYMKSLVEKRPEGSCLIFIFADNIMVAIKYGSDVVFASLDFVKAESTVSKEHVLAANLYALRAFPMRTQEWYLYMTAVLTRLAIGGVGVLGNQELNYSWLSSGTNGTHYYNSTQAVDVVDDVTKDFKVGSEHNPFYNWEKRELSMAIQTMTNGSVLEEESSSRWNLGYSDKPITMGIIGFDFVTVEIVKGEMMIFAILQEKRLLRTLVLNRGYHDSGGQPTKDAYTMAYLDLVKMRAAMVLGGWFYPPIRKIIWNKALAAQRRLRHIMGEKARKVDDRLVENMLESMDIEREWIPGILSSLSQTALPTIFEVFSILSGDVDVAWRAVNARFGTIPTTHLINYKQVKLMKGDPDEFHLKEFEDPEAPELIADTPLEYDVRRVHNKEARTQIQVKDIHKHPILEKIERRAGEREPVTDVGKPAPSKMVQEFSAQTPKFQPADRMKEFLGLFGKGFYVYRVPLTSDKFLNQLQDIKNERRVAFLTMVKNLQVAYGVSAVDARKALLGLVGHVLFIIKPWVKIPHVAISAQEGFEEKQVAVPGTRDNPFTGATLSQNSVAANPDFAMFNLKPGHLLDRTPNKLQFLSWGVNETGSRAGVIYLGDPFFYFDDLGEIRSKEKDNPLVFPREGNVKYFSEIDVPQNEELAKEEEVRLKVRKAVGSEKPAVIPQPFKKKIQNWTNDLEPRQTQNTFAPLAAPPERTVKSTAKPKAPKLIINSNEHNVAKLEKMAEEQTTRPAVNESREALLAEEKRVEEEKRKVVAEKKAKLKQTFAKGLEKKKEQGRVEKTQKKEGKLKGKGSVADKTIK